MGPRNSGFWGVLKPCGKNPFKIDKPNCLAQASNEHMTNLQVSLKVTVFHLSWMGEAPSKMMLGSQDIIARKPCKTNMPSKCALLCAQMV